MNLAQAKACIDRVITISRVHLYKPIQVAEILNRHRTSHGALDLSNKEAYRVASRGWRDVICNRFLGRTSTSSIKFQDDIFNPTAVPPEALVVLGRENMEKDGIVEAYIYRRFAERYTQMSAGLQYCSTHTKDDFDLQEFLDMFWREPGLKRSIDKIYEIVVFALFSALVDEMGVTVEVSMDPDKVDILAEFEDFAKSIFQLTPTVWSVKGPAKIYRVGVTNAADRGMDMWASFGLAIQIKHLSLTEELAEDIVHSISADRIVIVCKQSERGLILSLLNQIGWRSRIQAIITELDLIRWYEKALRGRFSEELGTKVMERLVSEIVVEFPTTDNTDFNEFMSTRGYAGLSDLYWS